MSDSWRVIWSSCDILLCQRSCGVNVKNVVCCFLIARDRHWKTATTRLTRKQVISHRTHSASDREPSKTAKLHLECGSLISHIAPYFEISAQTLSFVSSPACLHCWFFFFCHDILCTNATHNRKYNHLGKKNNNVQSHKHTYDNYIIKVLLAG